VRERRLRVVREYDDVKGMKEESGGKKWCADELDMTVLRGAVHKMKSRRPRTVA